MELNKEQLYLVDFSKMNGVEDLFLLLSSMGITFNGYHPQFENIKHLLDLDNPINIDKMPYEQEFHPIDNKDVKLPKLKSVK